MWLLESRVLDAMQRAVREGAQPSAAQLVEFEAAARDVMTLGATQAEITVTGILTPQRDWMAYFFGGGNTTYRDIMAALAEADANPDITEITMYVDSPGGAVHGLFETIAAVQNTGTPINVVASRACSAAYALAAAAGPIRATSPASFFGSVGVAVDTYARPEEVSVTSTNAPNKRPDLSTEEGRAVLREELDALHDLLVDAIATGRGVDSARVNRDYGRGATLLAGAALDAGMIDTVSQTATTTSPTADGGGNSQEARSMDLQTLMTQHPDVYAAAVQVGRDDERDRVCAHLTMGQASGAMDTAIQAVNDGVGMTATLQATYMAAGFNRADQTARGADDQQTAAAADGAAADGADEDAEAKAGADILAAAAEKCGVEMGA